MKKIFSTSILVILVISLFVFAGCSTSSILKSSSFSTTNTLAYNGESATDNISLTFNKDGSGTYSSSTNYQFPEGSDYENSYTGSFTWTAEDDAITMLFDNSATISTTLEEKRKFTISYKITDLSGNTNLSEILAKLAPGNFYLWYAGQSTLHPDDYSSWDAFSFELAKD
ncbi:MAG: hypothetical protein K6G52_03285 [Treponemataceae bacterium]|nr:hypothetical protein [Treponemataceae bacterium]